MFAIRDVKARKLLKRYVYKTISARFMTQQKLHSVRYTGTAIALLISPDLPVKVWLKGQIMTFNAHSAVLWYYI